MGENAGEGVTIIRRNGDEGHIAGNMIGKMKERARAKLKGAITGATRAWFDLGYKSLES